MQTDQVGVGVRMIKRLARSIVLIGAIAALVGSMASTAAAATSRDDHWYDNTLIYRIASEA